MRRVIQHGWTKAKEPGEPLTLAEIPDFLSELLARLESVFRANCQYVGDQRIRGPASQGSAQAKGQVSHLASTASQTLHIQ